MIQLDGNFHKRTYLVKIRQLHPATEFKEDNQKLVNDEYFYL
jgi:hypothetical protein